MPKTVKRKNTDIISSNIKSRFSMIQHDSDSLSHRKLIKASRPEILKDFSLDGVCDVLGTMPCIQETMQLEAKGTWAPAFNSVTSCRIAVSTTCTKGGLVSQNPFSHHATIGEI